MDSIDYNLEKSEASIGQMLPVIKDASGRIVDGLHRKEVNPEWREEIREDIVTDEDYWRARAHLNYARRNPQEARAEKIKIVDGLAEYYVKQGLKIAGEAVSDGKQPTTDPKYISKHPNEVLDAVIKALDGAMSASWIRKNVDPKYTQNQSPREEKAIYPPEKYSPIEQLERDKRTVEIRYGEGFVDRLKDEMRKEVRDEIAFKHDIPELFTPPTPDELIFTPERDCTTEICDLPSVIGAGKLGKDYSHEALFPNCICNNCGHYNKCRGE